MTIFLDTSLPEAARLITKTANQRTNRSEFEADYRKMLELKNGDDYSQIRIHYGCANDADAQTLFNWVTQFANPDPASPGLLYQPVAENIITKVMQRQEDPNAT